MDLSMLEEMDRLIDHACKDPTTPEGRAALAQAAELWRSFSAGMRRGLTLAQNLPEPSRASLQALLAPLAGPPGRIDGGASMTRTTTLVGRALTMLGIGVAGLTIGYIAGALRVGRS